MFYALLGGLLTFIVLKAFKFVINLGCRLAFVGFLLIVGHAILRATHHVGCEIALNGSMKVGAAGGGIGGISLALVSTYVSWGVRNNQ